MIGFGTLVILGVVIGSVSVSMFLFVDNLTIDVTSEPGEPVQVGDVKFDVQFVSNYEILEKKSEYIEFEKNLVAKGISISETPDGIYFQIQITAHNIGIETVRVTGGQFHLYDSNNTKYDAVFIGYGDGELSLIDLEPNDSVTVTTQFDIPYDDQMKYRVGIIPDRYGLQDSQERGFICVKNCQN
jgi:hypothetical protein